jgi:ABC-2 type transport system ATP-binding protein
VLSGGRVIADDTAAGIRKRTGGGVIRCRTRLTLERAALLPAVRLTERHGRLTTLTSTHPPTTLRALLKADPDLDDLEVMKPSLEQAFRALTDTSREVA